MFYLHMSPPVPTPPSTSTARDGTRLLTPRRPKSAAPAVCVPTITPETASSDAVGTQLGRGGATQPHALATQSPRSAAYVGFSPRAPSAPRPAAATPATTNLGSHFQHVLQAHASTASPRRLSYGNTGQLDRGRLVEHVSTSPGATNDATVIERQPSSMATANVYHAMTARKSAEETAKQLARRIAHFRAQEEKVLREVHQMKLRLENLLTSHDTSEPAGANATSAPRKPSRVLKRPMSAATTHASRMAQRSDVKAPRSREQLQFLNKQRRVLQHRNSEAARQQKEKRQAALELQRQKEAAEQDRRAAIKARIQHERQLAIDERAARQQQLIEQLEQQHFARLRHEQAREIEVQKRINDMREEEKNLALRLQALQVHQEHIKRGLQGSAQSPPHKRSSPPRPQSARTALPPALPTASPRVEPFGTPN